MQACGLTPNLVSYGICMDACAKAGLWEKVCGRNKFCCWRWLFAKDSLASRESAGFSIDTAERPKRLLYSV